MRLITVAVLSCIATLALCACPEAKTTGAPAISHSEHTEAALSSPPSARSAAPKGAKTVTLTTSDGWHIAGWYWPPSGKLAPGVILLHQRGKDKSSWSAFAPQLVKQGYAVLAIDLRGHGESIAPNGRHVGVNDLTDADYTAMLRDVGAADDYLHKQSGVDGDRLGIIGASIGANLAIIYLAGDRHVRTAVCLSPGLDFKGLKPLDYMKQVDKRPLYLIASRGDGPSADAASALSKAGAIDGPKSLRLLDGSAHGTDLLNGSDGLDKTISTGWLLNYLPPKR